MLTSGDVALLQAISDPKLPAWYRRGAAKYYQAMKSVKAPTIAIQPRGRGWRDQGMYFSCIPDNECPWNPEIVAAWQKFAPDIMPMLIKWVFIDPSASTIVFKRHAVGRHVDNPHSGLINFEVDMPTHNYPGVILKRPHIIETIYMTPKSVDKPAGDYVPFDWNIYRDIVRNYGPKTGKELIEDFREKQDAKLAVQERTNTEREYIDSHLNEEVYKTVSEASEVEIKERMAGMEEEADRLMAGLPKKVDKPNAVVSVPQQVVLSE